MKTNLACLRLFLLSLVFMNFYFTALSFTTAKYSMYSNQSRSRKRRLPTATTQDPDEPSTKKKPVVVVRPVGNGTMFRIPNGSACDIGPCHRGGECFTTPKTIKGYECVCPTGYDQRTDCRTVCPRGFFGNSCLLECINCDTRHCHNEKGCSVCTEGFKNPPLCLALNCRSNYNPCYNRGQCRPKESACWCLPGFTGSLCETKLNLDQNTERPCTAQLNRNCQNGGWCFLRNFNGQDFPLCQCPLNFAGETCAETCVTKSHTCQHGRCVWRKLNRADDPGNFENRRTGQGDVYCSCDPGWFGNKCSDKCPYSFWGERCEQVCGHCKDLEVLCDPTNGYCNSGGCVEGWSGARCKVWSGIGPRRESVDVRGRVVMEFRDIFVTRNPWSEMDLIKNVTLEGIIDGIASQWHDFHRAKATLIRRAYVQSHQAMELYSANQKRDVDGAITPATIDQSLQPASELHVYFTLSFSSDVAPSRGLGKLTKSAISNNVKYFEDRLPYLRVNLQKSTAVEVKFIDEVKSSSKGDLWPDSIGSRSVVVVVILASFLMMFGTVMLFPVAKRRYKQQFMIRRNLP